MRQRFAFFSLSATVVLYLSLLAWGTNRSYQHLHIVLLLLQYGIMLWGAVWCLRQSAGPGIALLPPLPGFGAVVVCFALLAMPLSWFTTRGLLNPDESGYSFQARIYRSGRIMADPLIGATADVRETPAELFYANHILRPSGWFPKFPPGWPIVLSTGYLVSANWLPNPILGSLQLCVILFIGSRCFSRETGIIASILAVLSPFYLVNSIGRMSHALCAVLAAAACLALFRGLSTGKLGYFAAMFACLAATFQVRPYTGFVLTTVTTLAALWFSRANRKLLVRVFLVGVFFGCLALTGVLSYNHICTGKWLVSPYAQAAGVNTPPELSINPIAVWRGMARYAPYMLTESLFGTFPFLYLLAGYAVVRENRSRREVYFLAALFTSLVLAYLAHPDGYGVLLGERFHFEAFFAVVLLAARGLQLLLEHWKTSRAAFISAVLVLGILQLGQLTAAAHAVSKIGEPYRRVREAVEQPEISGLVFLHDNDGFVAKLFNLNAADWRHASRIYLIDAQPELRAEWACRYGFSRWSVVSYDARTRQATLINDTATVNRT
jgi:hypothetical protein